MHKRETLCSLFVITLLLTYTFLASPVWSADFTIRDNGRIQSSNRSFSSMKAYVQSDFFRQNNMRCGARLMQGRVISQRMERNVADCTRQLTSIRDEYWPSVVYSIPIWWHVIHRSDGVGNIPDSVINDQIRVLNEDFRAMSGTIGENGFDVRIEFVLEGVTRTQNDLWFSDSDADEFSYKSALAKDRDKYINIYTNDARGFLGYAYFPQDSAGTWWDGIVLLYSSVGGRNNGFSPYDQGRTLVHEMGHYLGLYHTFQDGTCSNSYSTGDRIVDTNAESVEHYGCSSSATCGSVDPITNYMNYTNDSCMREFTAEQANRAVCSLVNYRPAAFTVKGGDGDDDGDSGTINLPPILMPLILK